MAGMEEAEIVEEVELDEGDEEGKEKDAENSGDYDESSQREEESYNGDENQEAADSALEPWNEALQHSAPMAPPLAEPIPLGKPLDYTPTVQDIAKYRVHLGPVPEKDDKVHITKFRWDASGEHGQIRHLRVSLSSYLYRKLNQSLPLRNPVRAMVYDRGGMLQRVVAVSISLFTDGLYVPLGGQHITSALWRLYTDQRSANIPEDEIPEFLKFVWVEILGTSTPFEVRQLAAGEHQQIQSDTSDTLTHEVFRHLRKKALWLLSNGKSAFLDDQQLWLEVQAMGLFKKPDVQKGRKKAMGEARSKKGKSDEDLEVRTCFLRRVVVAFSSHRKSPF